MSTRRTRPATARRRRTRAGVKSGVSAALARNPMSVLLLLSFAMFAFTWAYWQAGDLQLSFKGGLWDKPGHVGIARNVNTDRYINRRFVMGGVKLGMTRAMVEDMHPEARVARDRTGDEVLTIPTTRGMLVAWFYIHEEVVHFEGQPVLDPVERVYRLRLDEAFVEHGENTLLTRYAREYGRPIDTDCTRNGLGDNPRCTYHWWGGDGIELSATVKKKADINGNAYTLVTTVATDTITGSNVSTASLSAVSGQGRWGYVN